MLLDVLCGQLHEVLASERALLALGPPGGNCIKIALPGKLILRDFFLSE